MLLADGLGLVEDAAEVVGVPAVEAGDEEVAGAEASPEAGRVGIGACTTCRWLCGAGRRVLRGCVLTRRETARWDRSVPRETREV